MTGETCERCRRPIKGEHYSDRRCNTCGIGVLLCGRCCAVTEELSDAEFSAGDWTHEPAVCALAAHLECDPGEVEPGGHHHLATYECETQPGEWLVLTDSEADAAFKESLESYEDDMMSDWPETARMYFDSESWQRDVRLSDGRGPTLAGYDGAENEAQIDGVWYFIYRVN